MKNRFLRNSTFGSLAGMAATLGSFVSGLIVARMLGVEKTGLVAAAVWGAQMATSSATLGVPFTLSRFIPELTAKGEAAEAERLVSTILWPYLAFALIPAAGFLVWSVWTFEHLDAQSPLSAQPLSSPLICAILSVFCLTQALSAFSLGYLKGTQRFQSLAVFTASSMLLQLVTIAVGAYFYDYPGAIVGYLAGNVPLAFYTFFRFGPSTKLPADLKGRVIRYSAYRWAAEIASVFVWSKMELLLLQYWWGGEQAGLFTIALTLANFAVQGPLLLTWGLLPRFSEQFGRNDFDGMSRGFATATRLMSFLVFPACFGLAAIMPEFLPLVFGQSFAAAVPLAIVVVCGAAITTVMAVGGNILLAMERSDVDFYAGLIGAVLTLVCGYLLIRTNGAMGAAWSRTITQTIAVVFGCYILTRQSHFSLPWRGLIRITTAAVLCGAAARLIFFVLPGTAGLPFAIVAGALTYMIAIRALDALSPTDIVGLQTLVGALPGPAARIGGLLLRFISKQRT